jgi:hypothetical protein
VARDRYSWPALVDAVSKVYDEVAAGREPEEGRPTSLPEIEADRSSS